MRLFNGTKEKNHRGNLCDYSANPHAVVAELKGKGLTLKVGIGDFKNCFAATYEYVMGNLEHERVCHFDDLVVDSLNRHLFKEFHELFIEKAEKLYIYSEEENDKLNDYLKKRRKVLKEAANRNKDKVLKRRELSVIIDGERLILSGKRQRKIVNSFIDSIVDSLVETYKEAITIYGTDLSTSMILFSDGMIDFDLVAERMKKRKISDLSGEDVAVLWFDEPCQFQERFLYFFDDPGSSKDENGLITIKTHIVSGGRIISRSNRDTAVVKKEIDSIHSKLSKKEIL